MLYSTMATLKLGMDILDNEKVTIDSLTGHGGLFKTEGVGSRYMAAALNTPITVMKTAGEGGPYGMALLSAFSYCKTQNTLEEFLTDNVFLSVEKSTLQPNISDVDGFNKYITEYKKLLQVEKTAVDVI